jgi:hypothetical protein
MPDRYGTRPQSLNPIYWIGWAIGAGVSIVFREFRYVWDRSKTASASERTDWTYRAVLSAALVTVEFLLLYKVFVRPDNPLAIATSWLVLFLLPRPVPRLPLLAPAFLRSAQRWLACFLH